MYTPFFDVLMKNCIEDVITNTKLFTRRSAGIPLLLTSILVSATDSQKDELTHIALTQLLKISVKPVDTLEGEPIEWRLPQVHAQNAMKAIFTEGKLAQSSFGHIESAFAVAIDGFGSDMYPPRFTRLIQISDSK